MKCKVCGKECLSTARTKNDKLINCCRPCMKEKGYTISCIWTSIERRGEEKCQQMMD
jgi:hypothetical protein